MPDNEERAQATVRDGDASISVLVMMLRKDGQISFYLGKMEVSLFLQIMFRRKKNAGKLRVKE
ncbi:MAG: hypothetical protein ACLRX7_05950 [Acutalibacteraceae bacterium]